MEGIQQGGRYNLYSGIFNNDNKTYFPARTTTLGYKMMKLLLFLYADNIITQFENLLFNTLKKQEKNYFVMDKVIGHKYKY